MRYLLIFILSINFVLAQDTNMLDSNGKNMASGKESMKSQKDRVMKVFLNTEKKLDFLSFSMIRKQEL